MWREFNAGTKTITGGVAQTIVFSGSEIQGPGVRRFLFEMSGAGNDVADLTRIRIKSGSDTLYDFLPSHWQALMQRLTMSNQIVAGADTNFTVPFFDLETGNQVGKELAGFPLGNEPTIEVVVAATAVAGTIRVGYELSSRPPQYVPRFVSVAMNVAASNPNASYILPAGGWLRAYTINTTGLNRFRMHLDGAQVTDLSGAMLIESERDEDPNTVTNPICRTVYPMREVTAAGRSRLELDTAATWAGATNEFGMLTWHPQSVEAAKILAEAQAIG